MDVASFSSAVKNFFREDTGEVVGAYFDGEKIFLARLTETFETVEISADGDEFEHLAEKISEACRQRGWKTQAVGFCLRDRNAVTFQTEVANVPEKDFPALVESWSRAQSGDGALNSFAKVGGELWMETLPKAAADEICAAFQKFGLNLLALSLMPPALLTKKNPLDKARFIAEVADKKTLPNFLRPRGNSWNVQKLSATVAVIFFIAALIFSAEIFSDWRAASNELDAEKISVNEMRDDLSVKKFIDDDTNELRRLHGLIANVNATKTFNLLVNLGKTSGGDMRLTKIHVDENSVRVEGLATKSELVKNYLARMKNSVVQSARLENSSARDDGEIVFVIRGDLKTD
ncbi:MAG: hypothetical protein IKE46_04460 [Selenomonadaceae bacterium]|nr:hypothetical protein [Selenomonadaceae bacterium]